ncbi:MAG: MaoC family dehydratase [Actinomycetota bacterium]|nr:MaoC family dehydratase [Actinomycetota bacterium]
MTAVVVEGVDGLRALIGKQLGWSEPLVVTQQMVNEFASATGDHQWIHVDVGRAVAESPFGGPIAHGYLTLAFIPVFLPQLIDVLGFRMGVNYGAERIRFPAPVPVGASLRATSVLDAVEDVAGGIQLTLTVTIQDVDAPKPACVATVLLRRYT